MARSELRRDEVAEDDRFHHSLPPTMPVWEAGHPPVPLDADPGKRRIVLENHVDVLYEGQRIILISAGELSLLLPRMLGQRDALRARAAIIRSDLDQARKRGWEVHNFTERAMRRRADQVERLLLMGEQEARISQAIIHTFQRLLVLSPGAVIYGPYP